MNSGNIRTTCHLAGLEIEHEEGQERVGIYLPNGHGAIMIGRGLGGHLVITAINCCMVVGHDDFSDGPAIRVVPNEPKVIPDDSPKLPPKQVDYTPGNH